MPLPKVAGYPYWARRKEPHPFGKGKTMEHKQVPDSMEYDEDYCQTCGEIYSPDCMLECVCACHDRKVSRG